MAVSTPRSHLRVLRPPQNIPAADLVIQRVEPPPGIGLGRPVQRMLQSTDRITYHPRSRSGGTSLTGTHRAPPRQTLGTDETAALPITGGYVVRPAQPVLRPPPTPTRPAIHFPRSSVIGRHAPVTQSAGHRAGEGLPSSRRHHRCVPGPIRRGVPHGCPSRLYTASMAFALISGARLSLLPPLRAGPLTTPQASRHATDRIVAPPRGLLTLGSDPARFQTKPPACYRASWQLPGPDFHRQATTSLRTARSAATSQRHLRSAGRTKSQG
jgi:hypothetical protein